MKLPEPSMSAKDSQKSIELIKELYRSDDRVMSVGFSAGKDSTIVVDLMLKALLQIPKEERHKKVWVLLSKTGQDLDPMERYIDGTIAKLKEFVKDNDLPVEVHVALPEKDNTFWISIVGRGFVLPNNNSSGWCVSRLKIDPQAKILQDSIFSESGNVDFVSLTGTRAEEGAKRKKRLEDLTIDGALKQHTQYPGSAVLAPIEFWTTKDVWTYMTTKDPLDWFDVDEIIKLYSSTNGEGGECSTILDATGGTKPGCAASGGRFGCWSCTKMKTDHAQTAMAQHEGYEYLQHRLNFRKWLTDFAEAGWEDTRDVFLHGKRNHSYRPYTYVNDRLGLTGVGGLTLDFREQIMDKLLETEFMERKSMPDSVLMTDYELKFIAEAWFWYGDLNYTAGKIGSKYGRDIEYSETLVKMIALAKMVKEVSPAFKELLSFKHEIHVSDRFFSQYILEFVNDLTPDDLEEVEIRVARLVSWAKIRDQMTTTEAFETCPILKDVEEGRLIKQFFPSKEKEAAIRSEWANDKPYNHTIEGLYEKGLLSKEVELHDEWITKIDERINNSIITGEDEFYDYTEDPTLSMEEKIAYIEDFRDEARSDLRKEMFGAQNVVGVERSRSYDVLHSREVKKEEEEALREAKLQAKELAKTLKLKEEARKEAACPSLFDIFESENNVLPPQRKDYVRESTSEMISLDKIEKIEEQTREVVYVQSDIFDFIGEQSIHTARTIPSSIDEEDSDVVVTIKQ